MHGYLCLILHAHLPFVRHPEHEKSLEEAWLFEAITETYLPLLQLLEQWTRDRLPVRLTLTLSPTLCSMLRDALLRERYARHLQELIELADRETHRTFWEKALQPVACMYHERLNALRQIYLRYDRDLVKAFGAFQQSGILEIITTAATHAVLPLLAQHPAALRAQVLVARDHYASCFGCQPRGIWLPECAYAPEVEPALREAGLRWFILDTHGVLHAQPRPRYGVYAPLITPGGLAAFGRDLDTAKQVWSKHEGYPGDRRYRDFYRDAGYDLDLDYLRPYLPAGETRSYTGLKYYAITGPGEEKQVYDRSAAMEAVAQHSGHFVQARQAQVQNLAKILGHPPLLVSPYDAELFGHWWYEGPEFLDQVVRKAAAQKDFLLVSPAEYLALHPTQQVAQPASSSWGEGGYWHVWLNDKTAWMYPHLDAAQRRMTELARRFPLAEGLIGRALQQAGRELLLAQSSDWPFILRAGTSPGYARQRFEEHLRRFNALAAQVESGEIDEAQLLQFESWVPVFPNLDYRYWA